MCQSIITPKRSFFTISLWNRLSEPLSLRFSQPVATVSYGPAGRLQRHELATPQTGVASSP